MNTKVAVQESVTDLRREYIKYWDLLLTLDEESFKSTPALTHVRLAQSLSDVKIRDVVLHRLANMPFDRALEMLSTIRYAFEAFRVQAAEDEVFIESDLVPLHTITGAIYWFSGADKSAARKVSNALAIDSEYSFARLLDAAMENKIPSQLLLEDVLSLTEDELLGV